VHFIPLFNSVATVEESHIMSGIGATKDVHSCVPLMCADPIDGIKGKTWGPSTMHKDRYHSSSSVLSNDRCCKSAPNIQKTLCRLGGHSNIGALQELGKFPVKYIGIFMQVDAYQLGYIPLSFFI